MAQSKSRKLVTGTISAAVIASALAPVAASASVKVPNVKSATPLNAKQIKVVFDNGKTATITLPYSFKDGSTVTSFTYAGHYYKSVKLTTPYAPGVKTVTATGAKQIKVVFTDGVTKTINLPYNFKAGSTVTSFTYFGHSYKSVKLSTPYVANVKLATVLSEKSIKVLFDNGESATITLPYRFKDGSNVASFTYAGHYYSQVKLSAPYIAAPAVSSVSAINGTQLLVKFNKAVNAYSTNDGSDAWTSSAANTDNYSLSGSNSIDSAEVQADGKSVVLTLDSAVQNTTSATYGLTVSGVTLADTVTAFPTFAGVVTVSDTTAPTVTAASSSTNGATATSTVLTFSKPVTSVGTIKIDGTVVSSSNYTLVPGSTTLTINNLSLDSSKSHTVEVVSLEDASGNVNAYQSTSIAVTKDAVAPVISSVTANGDTSLEITFSKKMTSVPSSSFSLKSESYGDLGTVTVKPDPSDTTGTKYIATFPQDNTFFANSNTRNLTLVVSGTGVTDSLGNVLAATTKTVSVTKDTTAPAVTGVTVQKDTNGAVTSFTVNFNKPLAAGTISSSAVTLVNSNGILLDTTNAGTKVISDATVADGATKAVFNVANGAVFSGQYSFDLAAKSVTDQSYTGNQNAEYSATVDAGTASAGTFTGTAVGTSSVVSGAVGDVITVTYSTPVKGGNATGSATLPSNYSINGSALPAGTVITLDGTQKVATIKLPAGSYTTTDSAAVLRAQGVVATSGATLSPMTQTVLVTDNVAPVLKTASVNADNSLTLGFDSTVASAATPDLSDLVITVNGSVVPTGELSIADGTGSDTGKYVIKDTGTLNFTTATSIVVGTASTTSHIADAAGNVVTAGTTITVK